MNMRLTFAGAAAAAAMAASLITASAPHADAAYTTYSTTTRVEKLVTPKCYSEDQVTKTYFGWSSKVGHYVPLPAPRVTTSHSLHCHK